MMKRIFDLVSTIGTAPLWVPVLGVVALLVWWRLGALVFFRQVRPGLHAAPFVMAKFRTLWLTATRCSSEKASLPQVKPL